MIKNINFGIDLLKIVSAFLVVLLHTVCAVPLYCTWDMGESVYAWAVTVHQFCNIAVPIFFIITGYLFLGSEKECTYASLWHNIRRFLLVLFFFGSLYSLMEQIYNARSFKGVMVWQALVNVMTGNLWDHMWYVYAIMGIYLLLPVVKPFFSTGNRQVVLFTSLAVASSFVLPFLAQLTGYPLGISIPITCYVTYVFLGGMIGKLNIPRPFAILCSGLFVGCMILLYYMPVYRGINQTEYTSLLICLLSGLFVVCIVGFLKEVESVTWVHRIAQCTWGIYLFHPVFLNVQTKVFHWYALPSAPLVSMMLEAVGLFFLSFLLTYVLRTIPVVRKFLL